MEYDLFHFEHQVPGGMMTNLTRQLREIKMEHRLDEILEEVMRVRREYGYPVMATPYSQIVGAQAFENVVSGERYKNVTDESIKYLLGYYGEPAFPLDPELMDRVMSLPRTKELLDWKPEGYLKSVEELRQEIGPDLSDDDLLLKILIPGRPAKRERAGRSTAAAPRRGAGASAGAAPAGRRRRAGAPPDLAGVPQILHASTWTGRSSTSRSLPSSVRAGAPSRSRRPRRPRRRGNCPRARSCAAAPGLVLSIQVKVGDAVAEGDEVAMIETMKMRRYILSSQAGSGEGDLGARGPDGRRRRRPHGGRLSMIEKILIANRGEIAVRVMRACREMGIPSVAVYLRGRQGGALRQVRRRGLPHRAGAGLPELSQHPEDHRHRQGNAAPTRSIPATASWPRIRASPPPARARGIKFIGPSSRVLELMGDKVAARREMIEAGVPVVPGSERVRLRA